MKDLKIICLVGILAMIFVGCLLYPNKNQIIQAEAIVALVFVTLVYAIETHKLVKEGQMKRVADFYEKRINEFYGPFIEKLNDLRDELHREPPDMKKMNELKKDAQYFLWQKEYMVSQVTAKKIVKLMLHILEVDHDRSREAFRKYYESAIAVGNIITEELDEITIKIRKIYGYSEEIK